MKCEDCVNYIKSVIQPRGGVLYKCKFDLPLNMKCEIFNSKFKMLDQTCDSCGELLEKNTEKMYCDECADEICDSCIKEDEIWGNLCLDCYNFFNDIEDNSL